MSNLRFFAWVAQGKLGFVFIRITFTLPSNTEVQHPEYKGNVMLVRSEAYFWDARLV